MKSVIAHAVALLWLCRTASADFVPADAPVRVVDGDTIRIGHESVRIENIDAPDIGDRARCDAERAAGHRAAARMIEIIASGKVTFERRGNDRYGRTLAIVKVDDVDIAGPMIAQDMHDPGQVEKKTGASWRNDSARA